MPSLTNPHTHTLSKLDVSATTETNRLQSFSKHSVCARVGRLGCFLLCFRQRIAQCKTQDHRDSQEINKTKDNPSSRTALCSSMAKLQTAGPSCPRWWRQSDPALNIAHTSKPSPVPQQVETATGPCLILVNDCPTQAIDSRLRPSSRVSTEFTFKFSVSVHRHMRFYRFAVLSVPRQFCQSRVMFDGLDTSTHVRGSRAVTRSRFKC